jgi:hypothetical protein
MFFILTLRINTDRHRIQIFMKGCPYLVSVYNPEGISIIKKSYTQLKNALDAKVVLSVS